MVLPRQVSRRGDNYLKLLAALLALLASPAAAQVPFNLPAAGSAGFEAGVRVCFKDIGTAGLSITPAAGALLGVPVSASEVGCALK